MQAHAASICSDRLHVYCGDDNNKGTQVKSFVSFCECLMCCQLSECFITPME